MYTHEKRRWSPLRIAATILGGFALAVLLGFVFGYVVMWLWNWLMPTLFGLPTVTFLQAVALVILGKLIFGGLHHHHDHDRNGTHDHLHRFFREKWHRDDKAFGEFWESEGKAAFTLYVERKKNAGDQNS